MRRYLLNLPFLVFKEPLFDDAQIIFFVIQYIRNGYPEETTMKLRHKTRCGNGSRKCFLSKNDCIIKHGIRLSVHISEQLSYTTTITYYARLDFFDDRIECLKLIPSHRRGRLEHTSDISKHVKGKYIFRFHLYNSNEYQNYLAQ